MTDKQQHDRLQAEFVLEGASTDPFAAAVRATRMPMLITDPNQPDNPIIFVNAAFSKLTGYAHDEIIGNNCRFLQGEETNKADVARIRDAIERCVPIEVELLNHKKNGEVFWNRLLISPVFDRDGVLTYFFASQFDVTLERDRLVRLQHDRDALEIEVKRRSGDLNRSEDRLRFMLKAGRFGTWSLDLTDWRLTSSDLFKENFGRQASDTFTYDDMLDAVAPEDRERVKKAVQAAIAEDADYGIEYRVVTPKGETRWVEIRGQTYYRADSSPLSMAGVSIDVTERKRSEEHRSFLAAELNHRVKNSMATMQSIANQTLRNAANLEEARDTLNARIQSLATAHDVLLRESWEGATLAEMVEKALQPFQDGEASRFTINGPCVRLTPQLALAFVMALHELATNAVKYGALSTDKGRVVLNWDVVDGPTSERLWLRWEEIGGPPVTPPTRQGFGTRMIERALASELGGTAEIDYRPRGVVFKIEAPLPSATRKP